MTLSRKALLIALGVNALLLAFKLWDLAQGRFDLYGDEAQYWTWAKALDWGYYSKPPVLAWLIAGTTALFGDTPFAIRLASPILHFITALILYALGARLHSPRAGMWASITYATLPAVTLSSALISTDPALLCAWALAFYAFVRAMESDHLGWWVLLGIAAGIGVLSKYSMVFFGGSVLLYLYWVRRLVPTILNPKALVSVLVAFILYLPNLLWNMRHAFVSYKHTGDNAEGNGIGINPMELLAFIGSQFGVFGPILFVALLVLLYRALRHRRRHGAEALFLAFSGVPILVIALISLMSRAHANWAATAYIAATLWVVIWLINTNQRKLLMASLILHLVAGGAFYQFGTLVKWTGVEITRKTDPFRRLRGHAAFAEAVAKRHAEYPGTKLVAEERRLVASLMYYLGDRDGDRITPAQIYKWNGDGKIQDHYDLVTNMNRRKGRDFLLISRTVEPQAIGRYFRQMTKLAPVRVMLYPGKALSYDVYLLEDFKGY